MLADFDSSAAEGGQPVLGYAFTFVSLSDIRAFRHRQPITAVFIGLLWRADTLAAHVRDFRNTPHVAGLMGGGTTCSRETGLHVLRSCNGTV